MILEARHGRIFINGVHQPDLCGVLVNADTGQRIPFARYANTDTGQWEALAATPDGKMMRQPPQLVRGRCKLRFVPAAPMPAPQTSDAGRAPGEGPVSLAPASSPPPHRRNGVRIAPSPLLECEEPHCHRMAEWATGDEQELDPVTVDGQQFHRGRIVGRHYYCSWHYRPPVYISARGVESEVEVTARPN